MTTTSIQWTDTMVRALPRKMMTNGYVRVKVPADFPIPVQNDRGWALEHRVLATLMLGRALQPLEVVHHRDGNKAHNERENLEVLASAKHHGFEHRLPTTRLTRAPGQANGMASCACGCGEQIERFDKDGRERFFVYGHRSRAQGSAVSDSIVAALRGGPRSPKQIALAQGLNIGSVRTLLVRLREQGVVKSACRGNWEAV